MSDPIKKIVIIGRDADAWIAALALKSSAIMSKTFDIEFVELPSRLTEQDIFVTLPSIKALVKMLGISETNLLQACSATFSMAQRFSNWSGPAPAFLHPYDSHGAKIDELSFLQYWLKAKKMGLDVAFEDFSVGAAAAKQARFVIPSDFKSKLSQATTGLNISAKKLVELVATKTVQMGLKCRMAEVKEVLVDSGAIKKVVLSDDEQITADLFIDASGEHRVLKSRLNESDYISWQAFSPVNRQIVAEAPTLKPIPAFSEILAYKEGWIGIYPLLDRTVVRIQFNEDDIRAKDALERGSVLAGMPLKNPVLSEIKVGVSSQPWVGNCVSIGDATAKLDPIESTDLISLHLGLSYLMTLFPICKDMTEEAHIYNEKLLSHLESIRDFQIAHYKLNQRKGDPLWDGARDMDIPESLAEKISLFSARGDLVMFENETFNEENWQSICVGHGLIPETYHPLVDSLSESDHKRFFQSLLKTIAEEVRELPTLQTYVDMYT